MARAPQGRCQRSRKKVTGTSKIREAANPCKDHGYKYRAKHCRQPRPDETIFRALMKQNWSPRGTERRGPTPKKGRREPHARQRARISARSNRKKRYRKKRKVKAWFSDAYRRQRVSSIPSLSKPAGDGSCSMPTSPTWELSFSTSGRSPLSVGFDQRRAEAREEVGRRPSNQGKFS